MKKRNTILGAIASAPNLEAGARHPVIKKVQARLSALGYLAARHATGSLDKPTAKALMEYQRMGGLPQSGILDVSTRDLLVSPRCGLPDSLGTIHFTKVRAWGRLQLTFAFGVGTNDINTSGDTEFEAVRNAFRTWAATGYFCFREVSRQDDPDILIWWSGPSHSDWLTSDPSAVAFSNYPGTPRPLPLVFDDQNNNWALDPYPPFTLDVESIALHEIGHCLGLGHSAVLDAVMYPYASVWASNSPGTRRALHADDLAGLFELYGPRVARQLSNAIVVRSHRFRKQDPIASFNFGCPMIDVSGDAVLTFQARGVQSDKNTMTINGQPIPGGVPKMAFTEPWSGHTLLIGSNILTPTGNELRIEAKTYNVSNTDDFMIDNLTVWYPVMQSCGVVPLPPRAWAASRLGIW